MPCLSIINRPSIFSITKSFIKILYMWSTYTYFEQLAFIYKYLIIISPTLLKPLISQYSFESTSLPSNASKPIFLKLYFFTTEFSIPTKKNCLVSLWNIYHCIYILFHLFNFTFLKNIFMKKKNF